LDPNSTAQLLERLSTALIRAMAVARAAAKLISNDRGIYRPREVDRRRPPHPYIARSA